MRQRSVFERQSLPERKGQRASFQPRLQQKSSSCLFHNLSSMMLGFLRRLLQVAGGPCSAVIVRQQRCVSPALKVASDTVELLTAVFQRLLSFSAPTRQQAAALLNREVVVSHQTLIPVIPASLGKLPQALSNAQMIQPSRWTWANLKMPASFLVKRPKPYLGMGLRAVATAKSGKSSRVRRGFRLPSSGPQLLPSFVVSTRFSIA